MADSKLNASSTKLQNDMANYITILDDLIKRVDLESNGFQTHASFVKNWICGFEAIFSEKKSKEQPAWLQCLSELSPMITNTYLSLIQTFHQYDPHYTQEFYGHWKLVLQQMNGTIRANSFISHIDQFKIVIQHLRTAEQRFEQFAILSVLILYIESVPVVELFRLLENDNFQIVRKLILLKCNHSLVNRHEFIYEINATGHCIQSVKPQKVICKNLNMHIDSSEYKIWLDFNKKDKSVVLLCISLAESANQTVAMSGPVIMRGNVHDHRLLEINGVWYVVDNDDPIQEKFTVKIYLSDKMEDSISMSTKNCFRFVAPSRGGPGSQGFQTGNELEPLTDGHSFPDNQTPPADEPIDSALPPNIIIAEPQLQRNDSSVSLPIKRKSSVRNRENLNSSCPVPAAKKPYDRATAKRISMDPNSSVHPITPRNDTRLVGERHPGEMNTTYVVRQSVDPIASKQLGNDRDNYDEISMDIEYPPIDPSNRNDSAATYNVCRSVNFALEENRIVDDNANAGITFRRDDKFHDAENGGHLQNGWSEPEKEDEPNARLDKKTIRVLEDVMIVPPRAQIERAKPAAVPSERRQEESIRFLHYSQVDENFTVHRNEAGNIYSQPTTRLEKFFVKNSPHQLRSTSPIAIPVEINDEMSDESHDSMQNKRKRATISMEENVTQKKCSHSDRSIGLSSQQTPVVGSLPIGTSSQSQYELFAPPTTSSQKLPVKSLLQKTLNSQSSAQSTNATNPAIKLSSHSRRTPHDTTLMPSQKSQSVSMSRSNGTDRILRAKYSESSTRNASQKDAALHPQRNESIATFDQPEQQQNATRRARNISQSRTTMPEESPVIIPALATQEVAKSIANSQNYKKTGEPAPAIDPAGISQETRTTSQNRPVTEPVIASQKPMNSSLKRPELLRASPPSATQKPRNYSQNRTTILESPPVIESIALQNHEYTFEAPPAIDPAGIFQVERKTWQNGTTMQEKPPVTKPVNASQKPKNSTQNRSEIPEAAPVVERNIFAKKTSTRRAAQHIGNIFKKVASKATKRKADTASGTRYSSLKRTKTASPVTRQSSKSSSIEAPPNNDSIHIDDSGVVYDDNVCVFTDNYELQRATQFYIANDGLTYLKSRSFNNLPAEKREKCERKLKTIHTMMNRGLERIQSSNQKICDLDPYRPSHQEVMLQGKKRKPKSRIRSTKQVSVTISTQQADDSHKVTVSRRTSKLVYVVDKDASSRTPKKHKNDEKVKSMHRATMNKFFSVRKNVDGKASGPSVNLTSETNQIQSKEPSSNRFLSHPLSVDPSSSVMECDQPTIAMNLDCAEIETSPKKLPIYASSKMKARHQPHDSSSNNTSKTAKQKLPIYASDKMAAAKRYQSSENVVSSANNINNRANGNGVNGTEISSCACGDYANEWIRRLTEMVAEPDRPCRGICKQRRRLVLTSIDPLQHKPVATNFCQLFNGTLASMESTCNVAEEQLDEIQKLSENWLD